MGRRKITEEAEEFTDEEQSDDGGDREQLTQRMPKELVKDVDEFADEHGMSRNAAINFLVKQSLGDW